MATGIATDRKTEKGVVQTLATLVNLGALNKRLNPREAKALVEVLRLLAGLRADDVSERRAAAG